MMRMTIQHCLLPIILEGLYTEAKCTSSNRSEGVWMISSFTEKAHYCVSYACSRRRDVKITWILNGKEFSGQEDKNHLSSACEFPRNREEGRIFLLQIQCGFWSLCKSWQILPFFLSYVFCLIFFCFILEPPQFILCILSHEFCFQQLLSAFSLLK